MLKRLYGNPASIICMCVMVMLGGIIKFFSLPVALYPDTTKPILFASLRPYTVKVEDFKTEYGREIEAKIMSIDGVSEVEGQYRKGRISWEISFDWDTDKDKAQSDVKAALSTFESRFPKEWNSFRYYFKSNNNARVFIAASSDKYSNEELWRLLQDRLKSGLERIEGIEHVFIIKPFEEKIKIELNYDVLLQYGISPEKVFSAIKATEYDRNLPRLKSKGGDRFPLSIPIKDQSLDDIKRTVIQQNGGKVFYLSDVAKVALEPIPPDDLFKGDGKRALIIGGVVKSNANIAQACNDFEAKVHAGAKEIDQGIQTQVLVNPSEFIQEAIENIGQSVMLGIGIATLVTFLFLGSFRFTLVIAISIPLSLVGGFIVMSLSGIELNLISLGAMALAVGMVVDGSIVVMENIDRHLAIESPKSFNERLEVIYKAVIEVRAAVIASLLTTIIVFAPLTFTAPLANAILGDLAKVIVCVLSISVVVTMLVVPPLMMILRSGGQKKSKGIYSVAIWFQRIVDFGEYLYLETLRFVLGRKIAVAGFCLSATCLLLGAFWLVSEQVKREILATPDTDKVWLSISLPNQEYEIEEVDQMLSPIEESVRDEFGGEIKNFVSIVHKEGANILCNLKDKKLVKEFKKKLEQRFVSTPKIHYFVAPWNPTSLEIPSPPLMEIRIAGKDGEAKRDTLEAIETIARGMQEIGEVRSHPRNFTTNDYEIVYRDEKIAYLKKDPQLGFSESAIEQMISYALDFKVVKDVYFKGYRDPLKVEIGFPEHTLEGPNAIKNLLVKIGSKILPLRHLLDVKSNRQWGEYYTERGRDEFKIEVYHKSFAEDQKQEVKDRLTAAILAHPDIDQSLIDFADTEKEINDNISSLVYALFLALGLIWIVVSLQFGSLWQTTVIMGAIPLGFIGVGFSLYALQSTLSVNSMLGCILLCGTAVNNSILFVDFYNNLKKIQGGDVVDTLIETAKLRFKPILITTATTILGMIPIAVGYGSGGEILQPLGIAVCGGLGISTFLTLIAVPVMIAIGERFKSDIKHKLNSGGLTAMSCFIFLCALGANYSTESIAETVVPEKIYSIKDLESLAIENSPRLKQAQHRRDGLDYSERATWGQVLPKLELNAAAKQSEDLNSGPDYQSMLIAREDIPNPYHLALSLDLIEIQRQMDANTLKQDSALLLRDIRAMYLKILLLEHRLNNASKNEELLAKVKEQNKVRYQGGFIHKIDVLKSDMQYDGIKLHRQNTAMELAGEYKKLLLILGHGKSEKNIKVSGSLIFKDQQKLVKLDIKALNLLSQNLGGHFKLNTQELQILKADNEAAKVRSQYLPSLSLSASKTLGAGQGEGGLNFQAGLSWQLFSGGSTYYEHRQKIEVREQAKLESEAIERQSKHALEAQLASMKVFKQKIESQSHIVDSWREIVNVGRSRYGQGLVSYKELSDDISSFLREEEKQLEQIYQLASLLASFAHDLGKSEVFYDFFNDRAEA